MNEGWEEKTDCESIVKSMQKDLEALRKSGDSQNKFLNNRVIKLIEYTTGRVDYYENARSRIFTASVTLLGFGVSLLIFGIDYLANAPWLRWSVLILIGTAVLGISVHLNHGRGSYSFQKAVDSPWFYLGNIPNYEADNGYPKSAKEAREAFCKDVSWNYAKMAEENRAKALERDIGQLVRMYAIMAYKKNTATMTTKVIERGFGLFILSMFVLYIVNLLIPLP